ncbi:MAG: glutamate dehydrogenase, partial [Candidatus Hermodarchaeota archaeon]
MIPKTMDAYIKDRLPEATLKNRLKKDNGRCYLEFSNADEHLLSRLKIVTDKLGPHLVACIWDEKS